MNKTKQMLSAPNTISTVHCLINRTALPTFKYFCALNPGAADKINYKNTSGSKGAKKKDTLMAGRLREERVVSKVVWLSPLAPRKSLP